VNSLTELWSILTARQRRTVLAAQCISIVMAFSTVVGIAAVAPFFAVLGDPGLTDKIAPLRWIYGHAAFSNQHAFVAALGMAFIGLLLLANLVNVMGALAMNRLALRIGTELQATLFAEYLGRPYHFHAATNSTMLFNNVVYEPARVTFGILQHAFIVITNLVTASFIVVSILLVKPVVAIAMIAGLAGGYALIYLTVRNRLLRFGHAQSRLASEQAKIVNESFGAIKEIIVLQVQDFFRGRFERISASLAATAQHSQFVAQTPRHVMECVAAAGLVGLALVLGAAQSGIGPWLGQLTFLAFAAYRLLPTLQQVFAAIVVIRADRAGLTRIAPDLLLARALARSDRSGSGRCEFRHCPRREIRVIGASYRYASDRPWALNAVSLQIPVYDTVGIVGANGSGKTTLVDVLGGLLIPETGRVEIDGRTLNESNRPSWQSRVAYVPQNIYLLDATIAQNVALGVDSREVHQERLRDALRLAQLDELIETLPLGSDHRIGEHGIRLSGGQRQRIGIARALYKEASVLLLDEATNALDGLTEQELIATLGRLRGRYTIVLVAHRMSTVRACDVVFEIAGGQIIDSGTPEMLLKSSAEFRRMAGIL
jgi:ABC-type multidrug transport system fused ATPase/permease subunit